MKEWNAQDPRERALFLRSLAEEGIEEIYLETLRPEIPAKQSVQIVAEPSAEAALSLKDELLSLRTKALQCTLCQELATTRTHVVFGSGNIKAELMFVGEAPGADEDEQGLPFVGRAGQLLTKIIESIGLTRRQVFIANVLKCRPPQNRQPKPDEIQNCQPFLIRQIELIRPKVICALGTFAAQTLLKTDQPIGRLRGQFSTFTGSDPEGGLTPFPPVKIICTYHPAYLLRSPEGKRDVWEDMKKIKRELEK
jgi:DNA polymerase